jgi:hypothetical protein
VRDLPKCTAQAFFQLYSLAVSHYGFKVQEGWVSELPVLDLTLARIITSDVSFRSARIRERSRVIV